MNTHCEMLVLVIVTAVQVLGADYVSNYCVERLGDAVVAWGYRFAVKAVVVVAVVLLELRGLAFVQRVEAVLAVGVFLPFIVLLFVALGQDQIALGEVVRCAVDRWRDANPAAPAFTAPPDQISWSDFLNTLVWASMGYDALGCIAGEVKNPGRTYPLGVTVRRLAALRSDAMTPT